MPGFKNSNCDQSSSGRFSIGVPVMTRRRRPLRSRAAFEFCDDEFLIACDSSSTIQSNATFESSSASRRTIPYVVMTTSASPKSVDLWSFASEA
jgi:hypothetical protein